MPSRPCQRLTQQRQRGRLLGQHIDQQRTRRRTGAQAQHGFEAPVAAHQPLAPQVGNAGAGALQNGGQLTQQLRTVALGFFLLGHVQRHHRQRLASAGQCAGLYAGHQPAPAQAGHRDRIAHLHPAAVPQGLLQALKLGTGCRLYLVTADGLQRPGGQAVAGLGRCVGTGTGIMGGGRGRKRRAHRPTRRPVVQPAA